MEKEPIKFSYKNRNIDSTTISLIINPENITIPEKERISQVMTKSRLVTFFWGKQPINFSYNGQTGSLLPTREEFNAYTSSESEKRNSLIQALDVERQDLENQKATKLEALNSTSISRLNY